MNHSYNDIVRLYVREGIDYDRTITAGQLLLGKLLPKHKKQIIAWGADVDALSGTGRTLLHDILLMMQDTDGWDRWGQSHPRMESYYENGAFVPLGLVRPNWYRYEIARVVMGWERVCEDLGNLITRLLLYDLPHDSAVLALLLLVRGLFDSALALLFGVSSDRGERKERTSRMAAVNREVQLAMMMALASGFKSEGRATGRMGWKWTRSNTAFSRMAGAVMSPCHSALVRGMRGRSAGIQNKMAHWMSWAQSKSVRVCWGSKLVSLSVPLGREYEPPSLRGCPRRRTARGRGNLPSRGCSATR